MSNIYSTVLYGCVSEPFMSYLKALGIFRLVAEQIDPNVRGSWKNGVFSIKSTLDLEELVDFFLHLYEPTPIVAPWAGGSGFFGKDNRSAVTTIVKSEQNRLSGYRDVIKKVSNILTECGIQDKPSPEQKKMLLRRYRSELPDAFVKWMDTAIVLQQDGQAYPPILGTGGNDGRLDFSQNFMQRLILLGIEKEIPPESSDRWLRNALLGKPTNELNSAAVGQFAPGRAGGPNMTQGMEGSSIDNPWDFILMIEGALVLTGSANRRLGMTVSNRSVFPFMVRSVSVGYASECEYEVAESRGELWLPLWEKDISIPELRLLFSEGRADIGRNPARNSVDFARAIASLGVDRGISSFVRVGFLKRSGKAFFATPLGRFQVQAVPNVNLLHEVDAWLDQLHRAQSDKMPTTVGNAVHAIESAIFNLCRYGDKHLSEVLQALGIMERELARAERFREEKGLRPLRDLSSEWIRATADNSAEHELAVALSSIYDKENNIGPLRSNMEPTDWKSFHRSWAEKDRSVVWNSADLTSNLIAVLRRRIMDGAKKGDAKLSLHAERYASLDAIASFLADGINDRRIESLLWGMILVDHRCKPAIKYDDVNRQKIILPRAYALLKLLFVPEPLKFPAGEVRIRIESEIIPFLLRGDIGSACRIAMRRLRSCGINPLPHRASGGNTCDNAWEDTKGLDPRRLAASLLFPIDKSSIEQLLKLVTRSKNMSETSSLTLIGE